MKESFKFESKKKLDPAVYIPKLSFIIAFIIISVYLGLTFKAMTKRQDKLGDLYRVGRIYKEQYDELMLENTFIELLLEPQEVMNTLFHKPTP